MMAVALETDTRVLGELREVTFNPSVKGRDVFTKEGLCELQLNECKHS